MKFLSFIRVKLLPGALLISLLIGFNAPVCLGDELIRQNTGGVMNTLSQDYAGFLNVLHFKNNGRTRYDEALVASIDFEWFQFGGRNVPLSEQIACVSLESTTNGIYYSRIGERLKKGLSLEGHLSSDSDAVNERWALEEIVEQMLLQHDGGKLKKRKSGRTRVVLVAHNTVAEWSMLADRDQNRIVKRLTAIRKSPVTGNHPIKLRNRRIGKVDLEIFDTRLLLPAGLQSLEKASALCGADVKKLKVSEFYKRNMHLFLRDYPELFERYALRDTEVTIKLFFLLQKQLNVLAFNRIDRPFTTLASAGVKGFLEKTDWFEEYREALSEKPFAEVMPIIRRSYLGGLNTGFFRGNTDDFELTLDYIFVDLDFSGAYPNGMARCAKIDVKGKVDIVRAEYQWSDAIEQALRDENLPPDLIDKAKIAVDQGRDAVEKLIREHREVKKRNVHGKHRRWKLLRADLHKRKTHRNKKQAEILSRTLCIPNNRHLDRWVELSDQGLAYEIPGFAKVRFVSSPGMVNPCLPIKKAPYGLCYVLKGGTLLPAVELVQAVKAGVQIEVMWSLELPVEKNAAGEPNLYFQGHLKDLVKLRSESQKLAENSPEHEAKQQILKEFVNGFYGKSAQGLNYRRMFNPPTGEFFALTPSEITEPSVAALVTAQVRAALAGTLLAIESYNKKRHDERPIIVISATTDGLLIGLPSDPGYSVGREYFGNPVVEKLKQGKRFKYKLAEINSFYKDYFDIPSPIKLKLGDPPSLKKVDTRALLKRFGHEALLDEFYSYPSIQNLRVMRQNLTGKDDFFDVKHLADRVVSIKTRGQLGTITYGNHEFCSLLARYGHKVPLSLIFDPKVYSSIMKGNRNTVDAQWLFERFEHAVTAPEIEQYPFLNLTSFKSILESKGTLDLVNNVALRRSNSDWDWKRRFERDESGNLSPFSLPHSDIASMLRYRRQADAIRKGGQNATPELVEHRLKVKGRGVRARNGQSAMLTRLFLRGLVQECYGVSLKMPEAEIAARVDGVWLEMDVKPAKTWTRSDINNARRGKWEANVLIHNPGHDRLLEALCAAFRVNTTTVRQQLFAGDIVAKSTAPLAQVVAQAVLAGPGLCIEPFVTLHREGALPGRSALAERLAPHLDGPLQVESQTFPMHVPAGDRPMLQRLFIQAGLSADEARQCAQCLSPIDDRKRKPRRNPSQTKCLELFVTALHQPDIHPQEVKAGDVFKRLKRFGLSKRDYYLARSKTLAARSLMATGANRRQIEQMSTALKLDAGKFLQALLEDA